MTILTLKEPHQYSWLIPSCVLGFIAVTQVFTINLTPSMPLGIYVKSYDVIQRGDIVAACLPESYKSLALNAGYLHRGARCSGSDPIIKEVIAVPGDHVILKTKLYGPFYYPV